MRLAGYPILLGAVLAAAACAYACGADNESEFTTPPGDEAGGGAFGNDGGGDGTSPDGSANPADTCGGKPCANNTGPKDFVEANAPPNAGALFGAGALQPNGTNGAQEPGIVYPSHETMFPINVSHIHHEWVKGGTNDLFRLTFKGPKTTVTIYTVNPNWEPSDEQWDWIAESNRGDSVTFTVAGMSLATPAMVWQSKSITLYFSSAEVEGALYYWSTGSQGIMKALVSDRIPEKFYTDPKAANANTCVACHTLSRDGKRMAVGYGGEKLQEVSVPARAPIGPATGAPTRAMNRSTI
jgi:hypothetical protein